MANDTRGYLMRQLETAWKLMCYHLDGLTTEECLWRPARVGLHVHRASTGQWRADWPDHEGYGIGPSSIAWLTWHVVFWWSMVIDQSFGDGTLAREHVTWPGSAEGVRESIERLHAEWRQNIERLTDDELTKNAAEIGYARFLYAVSSR